VLNSAEMEALFIFGLKIESLNEL